VKDRKVEAKESITSEAGTWDCYKITYNIESKIAIMGAGVPMNLQATEWFCTWFLV